MDLVRETQELPSCGDVSIASRFPAENLTLILGRAMATDRASVRFLSRSTLTDLSSRRGSTLKPSRFRGRTDREADSARKRDYRRRIPDAEAAFPWTAVVRRTRGDRHESCGGNCPPSSLLMDDRKWSGSYLVVRELDGIFGVQEDVGLPNVANRTDLRRIVACRPCRSGA